MSLINRVLNDLEDRSALAAAAAPSVISDLRSAQDYAQHERRVHARLMLFILGVVILALAGFLMEWNLVLPGFLRDSGSASGFTMARVPAPVAPHVAATGTSVVAAAATPETGGAAQAVNDSPYLELKLDTVILSAATSAAALPEQKQSTPAGAPVSLTGISHKSTVNESNIQLDLTAAPDYRLYILQGPDRLLLQSSHIDFAPGVVESFQPDGLIRRLRTAQQDGVTKLIFDLNSPVLIENSNVGERAPGVIDLSISLAALGHPSATLAPAITESTDEPSPDADVVVPAEVEVDLPATTVSAASMQKTMRDPANIQEAQTLFNRAMDAYRVGDITGATSLFRQVLVAYPEHLRARRMLASILTANGKYDEAKGILADGLQFHPEEPSFAKSYATLLLEEGRETDALEILNRSWPPVAADPEYHALAAAIFQRQGNHVEAAKIYHALLQINPSKGLWWTGLAISLEALNSVPEALAAYQRARNDRSVSADVVRYIDQRITALNRAPG